VFTTFTVPAGNIDARSNIVFSLLLTVVAFNYSISETIPKVPSVTHASVVGIVPPVSCPTPYWCPPSWSS
jgi:hypothetical protein